MAADISFCQLSQVEKEDIFNEINLNENSLPAALGRKWAFLSEDPHFLNEVVRNVFGSKEQQEVEPTYEDVHERAIDIARTFRFTSPLSRKFSNVYETVNDELQLKPLSIGHIVRLRKLLKSQAKIMLWIELSRITGEHYWPPLGDSLTDETIGACRARHFVHSYMSKPKLVGKVIGIKLTHHFSNKDGDGLPSYSPGFCPHELALFKCLKSLEFGLNTIIDKTSLRAIGQLRLLEELNLSSINKVSEMPVEFKYLNELKRATLHLNLRNFPICMGRLPKLTYLNIRSCNMNDIPDLECGFDALEELECINWGGGNLEKIPDLFIRSMVKLKVLRFQGHRIKRIPDEIFCLRSLEELDFSNNSISEITLYIGFLEKLRCLDLSVNRLSKLPDDFGYLDLTSLKFLLLASNLLESIPKSLSRLSSITLLNVNCNPFSQQTSEEFNGIISTLNKNKVKSMMGWSDEIQVVRRGCWER